MEIATAVTKFGKLDVAGSSPAGSIVLLQLHDFEPARLVCGLNSS